MYKENWWIWYKSHNTNTLRKGLKSTYIILKGRSPEKKTAFLMDFVQITSTLPPPSLQFGQLIHLFSEVEIQGLNDSVGLKIVNVLYIILYIYNLKKNSLKFKFSTLEEIDSFIDQKCTSWKCNKKFGQGPPPSFGQNPIEPKSHKHAEGKPKNKSHKTNKKRTIDEYTNQTTDRENWRSHTVTTSMHKENSRILYKVTKLIRKRKIEIEHKNHTTQGNGGKLKKIQAC